MGLLEKSSSFRAVPRILRDVATGSRRAGMRANNRKLATTLNWNITATLSSAIQATGNLRFVFRSTWNTHLQSDSVRIKNVIGVPNSFMLELLPFDDHLTGKDRFHCRQRKWRWRRSIDSHAISQGDALSLIIFNDSAEIGGRTARSCSSEGRASNTTKHPAE